MKFDPPVKGLWIPVSCEPRVFVIDWVIWHGLEVAQRCWDLGVRDIYEVMQCRDGFTVRGLWGERPR